MAREESSRENLLREATALVERIELVPHTTGSSAEASKLDGQHIVAGFRRDGALSIFFGEDPVYQFNAVGDLRRAYCGGRLLKAVSGRLFSLTRVRTEAETQLVRHELSHAEESTFLSRMSGHLRGLAAILNGNAFEVIGQVPPNAKLPDRLQTWMTTHDQWKIATRPNA